MATSYIQTSEPIWYIVGLDGLPAGGAQMFTYDNLTREPKAVYQDAGGTEAFTNPVIFDSNGTQGPFFWKLDSTALDDLYFIQVFDADGNFLWEADDFPSAGSGGGGNVTTFISLDNFIANNQFINHIDDQAGPLPTNLLIAPSNHKGFTPAISNPLNGTYGVLGPDIRFVKNNTNATDSLSFVDFDLSDAPLTDDVTPVRYIRYISNSTTGETYKSFQFPITQKVKNLSNQQMTFSIWAAVTSSPVNIQAYSRQYYGSGIGATSESTSTRKAMGAVMNLTTTWTQFFRTFTMPSVSGNSLGTPGLQTDDDAVYVQLDMPLNQSCDVLFTKPTLYLGQIDNNTSFETYDMIDSIDQTPRTGDIRVSYWSVTPLGWIPMNDSSIGNTGSLATYAGQYTFQLYSTLYTTISDTYAPVSGGRTAPGNTMTAAIADFLANKKMTLPLALGRALAVSGSGALLTARSLGQTLGSEVITINAMPLHNHTGSINFNILGGTPTNQHSTAYGLSSPEMDGVFQRVTNFTTSSVGGGTLNTKGAADGNMQPTTFMNIFIKL